MNKWHLIYDGTPQGKKEKSIEAMLTIGNGYQAIRGNLPLTSQNNNHAPGTYLVGIYNLRETNILNNKIKNEDFVSLGNLYARNIYINNQKINLDECQINDLKRNLCLKNGLLETVINLTFNKIKLQINTKAYVSMFQKELSVYDINVQLLNSDAHVKIEAIYDLNIKNLGVDRYRDLANDHLKIIDYKVKKQELMANLITNESNIKINILKLNDAYENIIKDNCFISTVEANLKNNQKLSLHEKTLITTSKISNNPEKSNLNAKAIINENDFIKSSNKWSQIWDKLNYSHYDPEIEKLIKINSYHLIVAFSENNIGIDGSITARGLHGEAYRGHIFWDEIFILPFYLNFNFDVAKEIINYRFKRLQEAKKLAKKYNYEGAMYPWQSGRLGDEQTQQMHLNPLTGKWSYDLSYLQIHVSLAIAYNVIHYYKTTNDHEWFKNEGKKIIQEIIIFLLSKIDYDSKNQKYVINNVVGPDEFHEKYPNSKTNGINNNAYTNIMTAWLFKESIKYEIELKNNEQYKLIDDIRQNIKVNVQNNIIEQYDDFFKLKNLDLEEYAKKYDNYYRMDRILKSENRDINEYQVIKQADTLMIFYLFDFDEINDLLINDLKLPLSYDYLKDNIEYYLKKTSHGSTLSRIVYAKLLDQIGYNKEAQSFLKMALGSDYYDIQNGTTAEGIHTGVMAASLNHLNIFK